MNPFQRRIFRWIAYAQVAAGLGSVVLGVFGVGMAIFGPQEQRGNAVGDIAIGFGFAFANGLIGGGLLLATRSDGS